MDRHHIETTLTSLFGHARPTRWVTRERPKIDRIACPWLIRRFIDPRAVFLYVPTAQVFEAAKRERAVAYDIPGAAFSHEGERCSFDSFVARFELDESGLDAVALIVRGADTDHHTISRPRPPGCMRFRSDSASPTPTITPCWSRAWSSTTPSMPGR